MIVDQKVSYDVTDLNALVRNATSPSFRKRKVVRPIGSSKQLFQSSNRVPKKKRLVDSMRRTTLYSDSVDIDHSREDCCSLQKR